MPWQFPALEALSRVMPLRIGYRLRFNSALRYLNGTTEVLDSVRLAIPKQRQDLDYCLARDRGKPSVVAIFHQFRGPHSSNERLELRNRGVTANLELFVATRTRYCNPFGSLYRIEIMAVGSLTVFKLTTFKFSLMAWPLPVSPLSPTPRALAPTFSSS